ncbi:MAG TPA: hypothetical protein PKC54_07175 [Ferruginibacter sp.]|nr:hypothetical protein [Ferruginibacter sp.]
MDHIIRDAAENHHPAYNDKAWEKMEKMLDKQLPQKKDKKKYIFFLLFFLLLGGGALLTVYQLNRDEVKAPVGIAEEKKNNGQPGNSSTVQPAEGNANGGSSANNNDAPGTNSAGKIATVPVRDTDETALKQPPGNTGSNNNNAVRKKRTVQAGKGRSVMSMTAPGMDNNDVVVSGREPANKRPPVNKKGKGKKNVIIAAPSPETEEGNETVSVPAKTAKEEIGKKETADQQVKEEQKNEAGEQPVKEEQIKEEQKKDEAIKKEEAAKKKEAAVTENKPASSPEKKKTKKNIAGNFGITVSAGPDLSFVSLNKLGKATIMYGAGLSYNFGKRLTARAGFYTSNKIYDAAPDQYHTPGGNYPYLYNIAAECRVYEIPVSLAYNFGYGKKHNWFGNVGLSSFLMKTEDYNYQYKTPSGQYYNYAIGVKDRNKHYFSVLTLSAGYNYKLSNRVSFQAEPYVKIPLGGVGLGKVKLNSGGILFTATIKPFAKKK